MTDLSIVIVTYRGWMRLDKCLASLSLFACTRYSKEIIVVDNTPDPGEISGIKGKYPHFTYIHNFINGGYGHAVNRGAEKSTGKFILVLNPDTVASEDSVDTLVTAALQRTDITLLSCRQVNENGKESIVTGSFPSFRNLTGIMRSVFGKTDFASEGNFLYPDWISGSVMLFRRDDFQRLNGFDEDYWMYFEDVDLCRRIYKSGGRIAMLGNIAIEHNHGGSSRADLKTTSLTKTEVYISRHVYICKNVPGLHGAQIQAFLVINNLVTNLLLSVVGLIFFFVPKIFIRTIIFKNLVLYYINALLKGTWKSPRSVNYRNPALSMA